jgi:hypothetical protein
MKIILHLVVYRKARNPTVYQKSEVERIPKIHSVSRVISGASILKVT